MKSREGKYVLVWFIAVLLYGITGPMLAKADGPVRHNNGLQQGVKAEAAHLERVLEEARAAGRTPQEAAALYYESLK